MRQCLFKKKPYLPLPDPVRRDWVTSSASAVYCVVLPIVLQTDIDVCEFVQFEISHLLAICALLWFEEKTVKNNKRFFRRSRGWTKKVNFFTHVTRTAHVYVPFPSCSPQPPQDRTRGEYWTMFVTTGPVGFVQFSSTKSYRFVTRRVCRKRRVLWGKKAPRWFSFLTSRTRRTVTSRVRRHGEWDINRARCVINVTNDIRSTCANAERPRRRKTPRTSWCYYRGETRTKRLCRRERKKKKTEKNAVRHTSNDETVTCKRASI